MRVHHWLYTEITADQLSIQLSAVISVCSCLIFRSCLSPLFTFRNILFHQAVQCTFHLYHNVHQPVVLFAKPLVFFFQSIFAASFHAHCFRPPYASSAAALSCVHFLFLKYIIHFLPIEKWFLNASFDTVRRTPSTHGQIAALPHSCCPWTADFSQCKSQCQCAKKRQSRPKARLPPNFHLYDMKLLKRPRNAVIFNVLRNKGRIWF